MRAFLTVTVTLSVAMSLGGCSMVATIQENTRAINRSAEGISTNTREVSQSSATLASLEPSMNLLAELRGPMEDLHGPMIEVAGLGPDLRGVSELGGPMAEMSARVTDLNGSMGTLMGLRTSMDRLMALESSMDNLANLEEPMMQLAALRESMEETGRLAGPMRDLQESMNALMALAQGPWVFMGVVGAVLWGLLTFFAVWMGVAVGMRRGA